MFKKWFIVKTYLYGTWSVKHRYFFSVPKNDHKLEYWFGPYKTEEVAVSEYLKNIRPFLNGFK